MLKPGPTSAEVRHAARTAGNNPVITPSTDEARTIARMADGDAGAEAFGMRLLADSARYLKGRRP